MRFGTPVSLLKYKPLSFINKIRFGLSVLKIKSIKDYKRLEGITAEEWIINNCGKDIYEKIWEPLLISKFGKAKDQISMAWLGGKIILRSSSGKVNGEELGYLEGSFSKLTDSLNMYLKEKGCKIKCNSNIQRIYKENDKWIIEENDKNEYSFIVSTLPYDNDLELFNDYLSNEERQKMKSLKFTSAKILILVLEESFSKYYWMNIGDKEIPFGGIVEHTNMIDKKEYEDKTILYISNYLYNTDPMYTMTKEILLEKYLPYLKMINPKFNEKNIIDTKCFEEEYAQPIIKTNYSKEILSEELNEEGLFICTMAQIYPEDRGMNYSIKEGTKVANMIINKKPGQ